MTADNDPIPFFKADIGPEEENAVLRVLRSGWLTTAKETKAFEEEFSAFTGAKHSLAVNSNTSGLVLSMEACEIREGTKILTTPYTFVSTATSARHLGAHVVYADIEKDTYSIDPEQIEAKLKADSSIRAIVPVHIAGNPCNMKAILDIAEKYGVRVIEDAAHAFPARTDLGYCGTLGDTGVFSFYATKTITTGEGGMICTNDDELAERMSTMRLHGIDRNVWDRYTSKTASWQYDVTEAGFKFNLPDILSAMGREQLKKANRLFENRRKIAEKYNRAFADCDFLRIPPDGQGNAWHLYIIRIVPEKLSISRDEFAAELQRRGIAISMHFIPHYHFSYWKNLYGLDSRDFPNAEEKFMASITLPMFPSMTEDQVERVIKTVKDIGSENYRNQG